MTAQLEMEKYERLRASDIREKIAMILYSTTPGPGIKPTYDILEAEVKEHWRQRAEETICLFCNILLNIGPANLLRVVADRIWDDGDKKTSHYFHDLANLLWIQKRG